MNDEIDERSRSAFSADASAEELMRQREEVIGIFFAVLIIAEFILYYFDQPGWIGIVVAIAWLGILLANELKLIYHELIELNDQIAGRKDEFRRILKDK